MKSSIQTRAGETLHFQSGQEAPKQNSKELCSLLASAHVNFPQIHLGMFHDDSFKSH